LIERLNLLSSIQALPRDLRLLFFSLFLWTFGLGVYTYVWSLYLTQLNANPEQVGLVNAIGFLAAALSMIPGGILANKYDAKPLLIIGWAISIPLPILFYYAGTWSDVIPGFITLQVSAFNLPAMNAFIGELADKQRVSSAFGAVYSAAPLGLIISPALGGILLAWFSIRDLFWVALIFWTVSTLILLPVKSQPPREVDSTAKILELPRSRLELAILLFLFGGTVAISITSPSYLPLYLHTRLGLTDSQVSLLGSVQSLGAAAFTILLGKWASTRSEGKTIAKELLLVAGGSAGILLAGAPILVVPMIFLLGGARAPSPVAYSLLSKMRRGRSRAGQIGIYMTFEQLGFVAGSFIGGLLYIRNVSSVLFTTFSLFLLLAAFSALMIRKRSGNGQDPLV
jgi:MFS transporter, ENTS family, enterobactin (siderophore) exporter